MPLLVGDQLLGACDAVVRVRNAMQHLVEAVEVVGAAAAEVSTQGCLSLAVELPRAPYQAAMFSIEEGCVEPPHTGWQSDFP